MSDYDVFVIGTGTAGSTAASICKNAGLHVGIADRRPFGGTCAQRGCDPKKLLVGAAEIVDKSRKMKGKGIFSDATIDWQDLIRYKNTLIDGVPKAKQKSFDKASIDSFKGECSFVGKNKIEIEGERVVSADKIVIATGAEPLMLNVPGWDTLTTSDKFLRLQNLPDKIIFVGGGYISFEFAHLAARSGADTVILNDTERPLAKFENFLVDKLVKASRDSGVDVKLNEQVTVIEKKGDRFMVETKGGSKYEAGLAVHGAGRIPAVNRLKLDRAGIDADKKGIIINDRLQSVSNPDVYVAGDANGRGIPLTPVAAMEGSIVGHNIANDESTSRPDYNAVPSVVFTLPPMASVGFTEKEVKKAKLDYRVSSGDAETWFYAKSHGYKNLGYKILIENKSDKLLGAHLLGYNSDEVINIFSLAMFRGITATELMNPTYAYPTFGYDVGYML